MKAVQSKEFKVANENEDGTFRVEGTEHNSLTLEQFEKLQALCGGHWLIFRDYSSPHPRHPKAMNFSTAM